MKFGRITQFGFLLVRAQAKPFHKIFRAHEQAKPCLHHIHVSRPFGEFKSHMMKEAK
jgi:hypothetical protein